MAQYPPALPPSGPVAPPIGFTPPSSAPATQYPPALPPSGPLGYGGPVTPPYPTSGPLAPPTSAPATQYPPAQPPTAPVVQQPPQSQVQAPAVNPPAPIVGLPDLADMTYIFVKQLQDKKDGTVKVDLENEYIFSNHQNIELFKGSEESDSCARFFCGMSRNFNMSVANNAHQPILKFVRPYGCQSCFFGCCLQTMEVYASDDTLLGTIEQQWSLVRPLYNVYSSSREHVLRIQGPCYFALSCFKDSNFEHFDAKGHKTGRLSKQWKGAEHQHLTDQDNYGCSFPKEMNVNFKALLMGACILIDYNYFEESNSKC